MTWANVLSTGSGPIAFRLVIEGMPTIWVTDSALEGSGTDDRHERVGFRANSFTFSERADITSATLKATGFDAEIVDIGGHATSELAQMPTYTTWLTADLTKTGTTIYVRSTSGWVVNETIHVGTECLVVTNILDAFSATVTRGRRDTIAQAHFTSDGINLRSPEVTTKPVGVEGRRAYVYALGDAESGNGTRIFAGVCATDARLVDGTKWTISIDPLTTLLDQNVGSDLAEPVSPRGIHYFADNDAELQVTLYGSGTFSGGASADHFTTGFGSQFSDGNAFFETQDEFITWINALIVTKSSGWITPLTDDGAGGTPCLQAVHTIDGSWTFQYKTGGTAYWISVQLFSRIDRANFLGRWHLSGSPTVTMTPNQTYILEPSGTSDPSLGCVPRGMYGQRDGVVVAAGSGVPFTRRIYFGGNIDTSGADSCQIEWSTADGSASDTTYHLLQDPDGATRSAEVINYDADRLAGTPPHYWTPANLPRITITRIATVGSVYDFVADITTNSQSLANGGAMPLLTSSDVNLSEFSQNVTDAATGVDFLLRRFYPQSKAMALSEVLGPELLLLGLVPCMDETGKICFRKFRVRASTDTIDATIDSSVQLGMPRWERASYGSVNDITLKTGYDPKEDKYSGVSFRVRDVGAYSRNRLAKRMVIEPKSYYNSRADVGVTNAMILPIVEPIIGLLGYAYDLVDIDVPLKLFNTIIGDVVAFTCDQVPNAETGDRGVTSLVGLVVGRAWKPAEGRGTLSMLVTLQRIAGYSPTSRVISYTNISGNEYDLNVTAASQPTGYASYAKWAVGDKVQVEVIDDDTPTSLTGTVTLITPGTERVRVMFDGAWTPGVYTWNLDYQNSDTSGMPSTQQAYAFEAADIGIVDMGATEVAARTFAP